MRTRVDDVFTRDHWYDVAWIVESLFDDWSIGRAHRPSHDCDQVAGWAETDQRCRELTEALRRRRWVRLDDALEHRVRWGEKLVDEVRKASLPAGWQRAARRACEEAGVVPGVLEVHPSRFDPGDDVEWPSARDEWWASDRAGDAFVVAAGDARGSLEQFGQVLASKLRSLAVQP